jgi:glycosyltransferase involved in cell wall biosynthesis
MNLLGSPSRYFADLMAKRLSLDASAVAVVPNGINLDGFGTNGASVDARAHAGQKPAIPVVGYFARMCADKGLDLLVDAYIDIRKVGKVGPAKLKIGGSCSSNDEKFVAKLRDKLGREGLVGDVEFHPNLDHAGKVSLLRSLSVFSVPARFGEAFGLYVIEAMAVGVPVVQPRLGAFTELVEATGGGLLYDPKDPRALGASLEKLLLDPPTRESLGKAGRTAVTRDYSSEAMARRMIEVFERAAHTQVQA